MRAQATERRSVFHLITTLDRGGAENALLHLCRAFAATGRWTQRVAWLKGDGELAAEFAAAGVTARKFSRRDLAKARPDVVHTHLFKADVAGAEIVGRRRDGRAVLVSTKHNEDRYLTGSTLKAATWRTLARRAMRRADAVVAISSGVRTFFKETLGDVVVDMPVIPYGLPAPRAVGADEIAKFRARCGVPDEAALVLFAGRLDPQKGHATAILAMPRIAAARDARLVLLGRGPMEAELRAIAAATRGSNVVFAGFAKDPGPAFAAADVVVLPSKWEGLGLALVEAAQHGRPAVATRVGGIPEVVLDGVTGVLVPPGDVAAFGDAVARLLTDDELRRRMGDAARESAAKRFSVERYAKDVEDLYVRLLRSRT
jgi:glycosyltransferase involved in cell wall biosynthesis